MLKKTIKIASLCLVLASINSLQSYAQSKTLSIQTTEQGAFALSASGQQLQESAVATQLNQWLNLSSDFSFVTKGSRLDYAGIKHTTYDQLYKGVTVYASRVIVHSKSGVVTSINGKVMNEPSAPLKLQANISEANAIQTAEKSLNVVATFSSTNAVKVVYMEHGQYVLAYQITLNGKNDRNNLVKYKVFVDAQSGMILKELPLMVHADVPATAETFYSGTRSIITDSFAGGYRLRDNSRNIETYEVGGMTGSMSDAIVFTDPRDVTNTSTMWNEKPHIMEITLNTSDPALYSGIGISFTTFAGNIFSSIIEKDSDASMIGRNNNLGLEGPMTLPYTDRNLFTPILEGETYTGRFYRDSMGLDFTTFSFVSRGFDSLTAISFPINTSEIGTFTWADSLGNSGTYTIANAKHPAIDVHWGISQTYDFYDEKFDYQSYDGDGGVIKNYYNGTAMMMGTQNNAAALQAPQNAMVYGTGDGVNFNPFVTLDVTAHEFTHLIMSNTANLEYSGESGALNESFSDIMGTAVEFYAKGEEGNWDIGETLCITVPFMRSMSDPNAPASFSSTGIATAQPDTYLGTYWAMTGSDDPDNGGVHINSGVPNKWFHLMSEGGSGTNDHSEAYAVTAIGIDKATNIAFSTFTNYMTESTNFNEAYAASLIAVTDLYGAESEEYATVKDAWYAVGIPRALSVNNVPVFAKQIDMFPNPATGVLNINSDVNEVLVGEISNVLGAKVLDFAIRNGQNQISLQSLAAGAYFVTLKAMNGDVYTSKLVVK